MIFKFIEIYAKNITKAMTKMGGFPTPIRHQMKSLVPSTTYLLSCGWSGGGIRNHRNNIVYCQFSWLLGRTK